MAIKRIKVRELSYKVERGYDGGFKTWKLSIDGVECITKFWSTDEYEWFDMDYAMAMASINNEYFIDGNEEFAKILSEQVYVAGIVVAKQYKSGDEYNPSALRYWVKWAKSQREKALNLGKKEILLPFD